jgi:hypothetical protein
MLASRPAIDLVLRALAIGALAFLIFVVLPVLIADAA